jgi:hypothetical protein
MATVASIVGGIAFLIGLVCYILILIKMFQSGQTGLAIACIVLFCCFGIGYFVAFVYGWMRVREWNIKNIMTIWSVCIVVHLITTAIYPPDIQQIIQQQQIR